VLFKKEVDIMNKKACFIALTLFCLYIVFAGANNTKLSIMFTTSEKEDSYIRQNALKKYKTTEDDGYQKYKESALAIIRNRFLLMGQVISLASTCMFVPEEIFKELVAVLQDRKEDVVNLFYKCLDLLQETKLYDNNDNLHKISPLIYDTIRTIELLIKTDHIIYKKDNNARFLIIITRSQREKLRLYLRLNQQDTTRSALERALYSLDITISCNKIISSY
jgi:Holliday junction resolvase RusA-like endonuclease